MNSKKVILVLLGVLFFLSTEISEILACIRYEPSNIDFFRRALSYDLSIKLFSIGSFVYIRNLKF